MYLLTRCCSKNFWPQRNTHGILVDLQLSGPGLGRRNLEPTCQYSDTTVSLAPHETTTLSDSCRKWRQGLTFEGYLSTWHSKVAAVSSPYTSTAQQLQPKEIFHRAIVDPPHPVCLKVARPCPTSTMSSCNHNWTTTTGD